MNTFTSITNLPNSRLVATNKFPIVQKVIDSVSIFALLKKFTENINQFSFTWILLNHPTSGECFLEQRITDKPLVDGYLWKNPNVLSETIKFDDSTCQLIVNRFCDGQISTLSKSNISGINRLEYHLIPNPYKVYFVHYLALGGIISTPNISSSLAEKSKIVKSASAIASIPQQTRPNKRTHALNEKKTIGTSPSNSIPIIEVPDLPIDELDNMTQLEESYKRQIFLQDLTLKMLTGRSSKKIEKERDNSLLQGINQLLQLQIEDLKNEIQLIKHYNQEMMNDFHKSNDEWRLKWNNINNSNINSDMFP